MPIWRYLRQQVGADQPAGTVALSSAANDQVFLRNVRLASPKPNILEEDLINSRTPDAPASRYLTDAAFDYALDWRRACVHVRLTGNLHWSVRDRPVSYHHPMPRPQRKDAVRNRAALIQAAREIFARRGFEASMDDIAEHAGLGVGTAYRHFANKYELADAIFDDAVAAFVNAAEEVLRENDP